ncbi:hypothetical protein CNMCM8980_008536 [Aspergillus fumigatiaffinis]|uniref:Uncharacterized protein n=1 Tax=Aspergillus fumigatiaffinis TaxID=340414 RepID=A0A8H4EB05_9EURO|nr:hypothetical protein CNMCM5878_005436 [Aspergillus fumigatiaffinis]KAF4216600.1 hypothetical protein CNMCM6457_004933 [Aspergillus fumigatiaffinis]KAF4234754.1 hypothetical protein CNMCM6805_008459 [Aspergillus fumigatiaffinis]KAF4246553.1 hypothetical protein CNMCM8980_008536 [Aspergillus fumigatiaffinis]
MVQISIDEDDTAVAIILYMKEAVASRSSLSWCYIAKMRPAHLTTEKLALYMYSGFSLSRNLTDLYNIKASCYRTLNPGETTITGTLSHGKGAQVIFTGGIQVHQA